MYRWHLGHWMLLIGVLVLLSESSSSMTIGLWKEPSGALRVEGPELFEDWEVVSGCRLDRWMGEGREDESDGIIGGDHDNGFSLLEDVSLVVKLYQVHQCKLLERMLQQILREGQVHFVHVVNICLILPLVDWSSVEGIWRLHSCLECLFDQWVISRHVECQWWWKSFGIERRKRKRFGKDESFGKEALFSRIDQGKDFVSFERQSLG